VKIIANFRRELRQHGDYDVTESAAAAAAAVTLDAVQHPIDSRTRRL